MQRHLYYKPCGKKTSYVIRYYNEYIVNYIYIYIYISVCLTNQLIKTFPFNLNNNQGDENAIYCTRKY